MSVGVTAGAASMALVDDLSVEGAFQLLKTYFDFVHQQQRHLCEILKEETSRAFVECTQSAEGLALVSARLEKIFSQIDSLQQSMDLVHEALILLNQQEKEILESGDVKTKAVSFLKTFGIKSKAMNDVTSADVWSRIPPHLLLNKQNPTEFACRLTEIFARLK